MDWLFAYFFSYNSKLLFLIFFSVNSPYLYNVDSREFGNMKEIHSGLVIYSYSFNPCCLYHLAIPWTFTLANIFLEG